MREVHVFYAYDDTEFFDRDECEAYEKPVFLKMQIVCASFVFFDEEMNPLQIETDDLETMLDSFNLAWGKADYVEVLQKLDDNIGTFIQDEFGFTLPCEPGVYKYWYDDGEEWREVGEQPTLILC